jgi:hypothetical protein
MEVQYYEDAARGVQNMRRIPFLILGIMLLFLFISGAAETKKTYADGTYRVGEEIESGLYKATLADAIVKMGYIERSKGVSMGFSGILANILLPETVMLRSWTATPRSR